VASGGEPVRRKGLYIREKVHFIIARAYPFVTFRVNIGWV
jgi:hypothetical protein